MKTITGIMIGCFIFTACGKREKETTYKLETNRAEDMMTSGMRESAPKYLILRVEHTTGKVAAVVTNQELQQTEATYDEAEAAYGDLQQFSFGEQQAFANGKQVQLQPGQMKLGESSAQTYYDGGCQFVQQQADFKLGTPQCSPTYALSKDTGLKYGLGSVGSADKHSFYRFGLKSYFGKDFDYPFTQQQPPFQGQGQFQGPAAAPTQFNNQVPADQNYQGQGLPVIPKQDLPLQKPSEIPYYQQVPLPTQNMPYQGNSFPMQGGQSPMMSQGGASGFQGSSSYEPPPIPASAFNGGGQGFPMNGAPNGGQGFPMNGASNGGQGFPMNGGQGFPMNGGPGNGFPVPGGQGFPPY